MYKLLLLCMLCATHLCVAYKVLLLCPMPGRSHMVLSHGVARLLLEAGHEVTLVTPFPNAMGKYPLLREIDVSSLHSHIKNTKNIINLEKLMNKEVDVQGINIIVPLFLSIHVGMFEHENVKKLVYDHNEQFDVVIAEWMFNEIDSGMGAVFNCPFIWLSTIDPHWLVLRLIDELPNPAYVVDSRSSGVVPYSFTERVHELMKIVIGHVYQYLYVIGREHKEYERVIVPMIRHRGHRVPDFEELRYNASLMLGNSHVSMGSAVRLPQSYKVVGGYHINPNVKPLPEDLQKLLDGAKNGLIYFSMGSILRGEHWPKAVKDNLLKLFGNLKQTVIWKFEEDLPNRPKNVHLLQWAPQESILAHPNCILFITHGGQLSTTEAIHFAKPIIGVPVFGDQNNNVDTAVNRGYAKKVELTHNLAEDLSKAIDEILADPSYAAKVKELSRIYHDRPVPPGKELVHWVEHVVRTGGALHLRSPALLVPWYQKFYLDLVFVIVISVYCLYLLFKKLGRIIISKIQLNKKKTQ